MRMWGGSNDSCTLSVLACHCLEKWEKGQGREVLITGAGEWRVMRSERGGGEVEPFTRGKIQKSPIDACSQREVKPV